MHQLKQQILSQKAGLPGPKALEAPPKPLAEGFILPNTNSKTRNFTTSSSSTHNPVIEATSTQSNSKQV
jgi:hypothetical protein